MKFSELKPGTVVKINHYDYERWEDFHGFDNQPPDFPGSAEEFGKQLIKPLIGKPVKVLEVVSPNIDPDIGVQHTVVRVQPVEGGPVKTLSQNWWSPVDKDAFTVVPLPTMKIPAGSEDVVLMTPIENGEQMVDFHGERTKHRYYTAKTYDQMVRKKNPFTNKPILPGDIVYYTAELDSSLPVQEAGRRRRKTRKTRKNRRYTRRR